MAGPLDERRTKILDDIWQEDAYGPKRQSDALFLPKANKDLVLFSNQGLDSHRSKSHQKPAVRDRISEEEEEHKPDDVFEQAELQSVEAVEEAPPPETPQRSPNLQAALQLNTADLMKNYQQSPYYSPPHSPQIGEDNHD